MHSPRWFRRDAAPAHRQVLVACTQSGVRAARFQVDEGRGDDWWYVAAVDGILIGIRVKGGAGYLGDDGLWAGYFILLASKIP